MTKEALQNHCRITRLTVCVVGIFLREISQLSKIPPPPSLIEEPLYFMTDFVKSGSGGRSSSACIAAPVYAALIDKPRLLSLVTTPK